jgi:hypothetical protein
MSFYIWNCGACLYTAVTTTTTTTTTITSVDQKTSESIANNNSSSNLLSKSNVLGAAVFLGATNGFTISNLEFDPNSEVGRENMGLLVVVLWWSLLTFLPPTAGRFWYTLLCFFFATGMCLATGLVPLMLVNKEALVEYCSGLGPFQ